MIVVDKFVDPIMSFSAVEVILHQANYLNGLHLNLYEVLAKACGTTKQRAKERFFGYVYGGLFFRGTHGSHQQEENSQESHFHPSRRIAVDAQHQERDHRSL